LQITQDSYNISKSVIYVDEPFIKQVDGQGNIIQLKNSDALAQAFKLWVTSSYGEKVRSNTGGPLVPHLGKAMTTDRANKIKNSILKGLTTDFSPPMTITNINIIPDNNKNRWIIQVEGYSQSLEVGLNTHLIVNNS